MQDLNAVYRQTFSDLAKLAEFATGHHTERIIIECILSFKTIQNFFSCLL